MYQCNLRIVFGNENVYSKVDDVADDWRKLPNQKLHKLHYPLNITNKSKRINCAMHTLRIYEVRNA